MAKFKVGDKVIANKKASKIYGITKEGWVGTVEKVDEDGFWARGNGDLFRLGYGYFDLLKPVKQSIHIYTDGKTTTAKLCEGKTVVKTATAKCHPDDEFDFLEGARWAFGRLVNGDEVYRLTQEVKHLQAEIEKLKAELSVNLNDLEWMTEQRDKLQAEVERLKAEQMKTPVFDWDAFKQGKIVVHCDTEEKAKAFLRECEEEGLEWYSGDKPTHITAWEGFKEKTCYRHNCKALVYDSIDYYTQEGYTIVPYTPTKPEPPKYYSGKVVCVESEYPWWTVGKVYEVKDGIIKDNNGIHRLTVKTVNELKNVTLGCAKFIELNDTQGHSPVEIAIHRKGTLRARGFDGDVIADIAACPKC